MSDRSAVWNSLMNSVHVVCIDQRLTSPSRMLKRRTKSMTRFVEIDELDALIGLDDNRLAMNRQAASLREAHVLDRLLANGDGRTLAHALLVV